MVQPKKPPLSLRPGEDRLARVLAWATDHGLSQHAAILALIDLGLGAPPKPQDRPTIISKAQKPRSPIRVTLPLAGTFERKPYQKKGNGK